MIFFQVNNNGSSVCPEKKEEDMKNIANIVIKRMEEEFSSPLDSSPVSAGNSLTGKYPSKKLSVFYKRRDFRDLS